MDKIKRSPAKNFDRKCTLNSTGCTSVDEAHNQESQNFNRVIASTASSDRRAL